MSEYYADREIFNDCDRELMKKGIDVVSKDTYYWPVLTKFLKPGENKDNESFLKHYLEFQGLILERIRIGIKVAQYKHPRDMKITRPQREQEVLEEAAKYAESKGLDPQATREAFDYIMKKNKDVQKCYIQMHPRKDADGNDKLGVVHSIRTQCIYALSFKYAADRLKAEQEERELDPKKDKFTMGSMECDAQILTERTGIKHYSRSKVEVDKGGTSYYIVELVKE